MENNKRVYTSGNLGPNPFEGIENRLPVNVVLLKRLNDEAKCKVEHPEQVYAGQISKVVKQYREACSDSPLCVGSLGINAKKLATLRVRGVAFKQAFDKYEMKVSSWPDALAQLMLYAAHDRSEDLECMAVGGLLNWASTISRNIDVVKDWKTGRVSIKFPSVAHVCARLQWMFLMLGISLADVGVCYEELDAKRYAEYKKRYFPDAVGVSGNDENVSDDDARKRPTASKCTSKPLEDGKPQSVRCSHAKSSGHYYRTDNYGITSYITVNGVVVMQGSDGFGGDGRISRSSSESEDTWKGVGFIARDEGRYGSLDGELYSD